MLLPILFLGGGIAPVLGRLYRLKIQSSRLVALRGGSLVTGFVSLVAGVLDKYVSFSGEDYTTGNPAGQYANTLVVRNLQNGGTVSDGHVLIGTGSIPDAADIVSATLYWYDHAYASTRGAGVSSNIDIYDNVSLYHEIHSFTSFVAGAKSHDLAPDELQHINKTGFTRFRFQTDGIFGKDRTWEIRAWNGYNGVSQQARLVVNYTEASPFGGIFRFLINSSRKIFNRGAASISGAVIAGSIDGGAVVAVRGGGFKYE